MSTAVATLLLVFGVVLLGWPGTAFADNCRIVNGKLICDGGGGDPGPGDPDPGPGDPPPRQPHDIYYTPACPVNGPPPDDPNMMCTGATSICNVRGEEGEIFMRIYYQWEPNGPWELQSTTCMGADEEPEPVITPDMIENWLITEWLPKATVEVDPPNGRTLINFPTIFFADGLTTLNTTRNPLGVPVAIDAEATSFEWSWGDDTGDTTPTGGMRYERGRSMDGYVTHKYTDLGEFTVSVSVNWTVRYRIGDAPWQTLETTLPGASSPPVTVLEKEQFLRQR